MIQWMLTIWSLVPLPFLNPGNQFYQIWWLDPTCVCFWVIFLFFFFFLFLIISYFLLPCLYIFMVCHIFIVNNFKYNLRPMMLSYSNQIYICSVRRLTLTIILHFTLIKGWDILSQKLIFMLLQNLAYLLITLIYRVANLVQCKAWSNYWCHLLHCRPFNPALPCPSSSLFINMFKTLLRLLAILDQVRPVIQERN